MERYKNLIERWEAFRQACRVPAVKTVRKNSIKAGEDFEQKIEREFEEVEQSSWNPEIYRLPETETPGKSMLHWLGEYYVQEESAALPVEVLQPEKGEKVLDMCAAPGGKTTQIASKIENSGSVIANDSSSRRMQGLHANIYRTGAACVTATNYDGRQLPEDDRTARRILLLTDGQDTGNFERLAEECADTGMSIMSAGIGSDYDEDVVRTLGEKSQGEWRHLQEANDIRDFFGDKVEEASTVVAASPELTLDVTTGTEVQEVYMGMPQVQPVDIDWQDNTAVIKIPDLAEGKSQKLVFKFQAPEREIGQEFLLANAILSTGSGEQHQQFAIDYTDDPDKLRVNNEDVEVAFEGMKRRKEIIEAETQVEQEQVETRIEEMEELHPDHEEVTRLKEDHQTIIEGDDPRAARDDVSRVMDDE